MKFEKIIQTDESKTTLLIRIMVSIVFLSEGIQKFLFPADLGAGRFEKIGLPEPEFLANAVGNLEILCGIFILIGLTTRLASIPLITIMIVATASTKYKILVSKGFWEMMHESRTDWAMLIGNVFLLIKGSGRWSADKILNENGAESKSKRNFSSFHKTGDNRLWRSCCPYCDDA